MSMKWKYTILFSFIVEYSPVDKKLRPLSKMKKTFTPFKNMKISYMKDKA